MSQDNLGNKQTIILHNCIINDERYDLVVTPHRQTIGYIRTKRHTLKRKIKSKQRQTTQKPYSKPRNAVYKLETSNLHEFYKLKDSINKIHQVNDQLYFSDSEATSQSSIQGKRRTKAHTKTNQYVYTIGINQ